MSKSNEKRAQVDQKKATLAKEVADSKLAKKKTFTQKTEGTLAVEIMQASPSYIKETYQRGQTQNHQRVGDGKTLVGGED